MNRILLAIAAAAATLALAAPASAQEPRQPSQYGAEDQVTLDARRAYIFFRSQYRTTYRFLREPDAAELAEHASRRAAELAKAREQYPRRLRGWERDREYCRRERRGNCAPLSDRPVEPTEANFQIAPPELDNFVSNQLRPRIEFADDQASGWLIAVQPGTYALYGAIAEGPSGPMGGCFCMGSVRFEARAGQITHLGEVRDDLTQEEALAFVREHGSEAFRLGHGVVVPASADTRPLPPQLANLPVVNAELRAADKMPNYFGVYISRLAPIDGVLGYRRDEVIDLRAGTTAQAGGQ